MIAFVEKGNTINAMQIAKGCPAPRYTLVVIYNQKIFHHEKNR